MRKADDGKKKVAPKKPLKVEKMPEDPLVEAVADELEKPNSETTDLHEKASCLEPTKGTWSYRFEKAE